MIGVEALYSDFHLEGGELLVFEFAGDGNFNVYIIGRDFCEVEYPNVVHALQEIGPRKVSLVKGGLKFVKFVTESEPIVDYMVAPISFAERCIHPLSLKCFVRYVLPNGKKINGLYDELTYKFSGLQTIPELLGNADLNSFNMLLLSYTEGAHLTISIFDDNFVEVFFPGSPLSTVPSLLAPVVESSFRIKVQPYMLLKYCHGVDIPAQHRDLWNMWSRSEYITVYSGTAAWKRKIRHRTDWKCTTIHDGWVAFRKDMALEVGDTCIFECPVDSFCHFSVRVVKSGQ
ncbi:uncharacterized protein LOC135147654 [Daucus carota subsp. sativus]|uniref:TF-B3 domain-containing protein n=1 Tax=Daucus carota subsp. sativus TaxID=79200 RepID=A0A164T8Y4_DAUCS